MRLPRPTSRENLLEALTQLIDVLQRGLAGKSSADGSVTLTFTAAGTSATVTVTHGLGVIPTRVFTQPTDFGALATGPLVYIGNRTPTTFDMKAQDAANAARTGTVTVDWLAIG